MRRARGEIQVFSVSFVDLLSCALGGILVLWLLSMRDSQQQVTALARQVASMEGQIQRASAALREAQASLAAERAQAAAHQKAIERLKAAQAALIGIQGTLEGAVFVFDTSASMESTGRFAEYKTLLQGWLTHLPFRRFNVVRFSDTVEVWRPGQLADATPASRQEACQFVEKFVSRGGTSTLAALRAAWDLPGVDTITLMSDGRPEPGGAAEMAAIHAWLAQVNQPRRVVINCVAMGDYFGKDYAEFLQRLARDHGGMFLGR